MEGWDEQPVGSVFGSFLPLSLAPADPPIADVVKRGRVGVELPGPGGVSDPRRRARRPLSYVSYTCLPGSCVNLGFIVLPSHGAV